MTQISTLNVSLLQTPTVQLNHQMPFHEIIFIILFVICVLAFTIMKIVVFPFVGLINIHHILPVPFPVATIKALIYSLFQF